MSIISDARLREMLDSIRPDVPELAAEVLRLRETLGTIGDRGSLRLTPGERR